ncbi:MAG TPA: hypothetical protein ENI79_02140 [Rhodospirillales bacterium]|nr:hypothetical protein [Rhodospirillales bacterium]
MNPSPDSSDAFGFAGLGRGDGLGFTGCPGGFMSANGSGFFDLAFVMVALRDQGSTLPLAYVVQVCSMANFHSP